MDGRLMAYEWRGLTALQSPAGGQAFLGSRLRGSQQMAGIDWGSVASNAISAEGNRRVAETRAASDVKVAGINAESLVRSTEIKADADVEAQRLQSAGLLDAQRIKSQTDFGTASLAAQLDTNRLQANIFQNFETNAFNRESLKQRERADLRSFNLEQMKGIIGMLGAGRSSPRSPLAPPTLPAPVAMPDQPARAGFTPQPGSTMLGQNLKSQTPSPTPRDDGGLRLPSATNPGVPWDPATGTTQPASQPQTQTIQAPKASTFGVGEATTPAARGGGGATGTAGKSSTSRGSVASFGMADLNRNARGWLAAFRRGEGTLDDGGYSRTFGGGTFDPSKPHPERVAKSGGYASAASGAYQFMPDTWKGVNGGANLPMTPENQDRAAIQLAKQRGVDVFTAPFTAENVAKLAPEWASLPNLQGRSHYNQPVVGFAELQKVYQGQQG